MSKKMTDISAGQFMFCLDPYSCIVSAISDSSFVSATGVVSMKSLFIKSMSSGTGFEK